MKASAPGKLNVTLACGAPDERGYHPLRTVFMAVDLREEVAIAPAPAWSVRTRMLSETGQELALPQELLELPTNANLAVKAAKAVLREAGIESAAALTITKRVPVAGGMAGGSADAAAAIVATAATFGVKGDWQQLARTLGADVPFALAGNAALGTVYGDHLFPVPACRRHWVFACANGAGLSTPTVFKRFDQLPRPTHPSWVLPATSLRPLEGQLGEALIDPDPRRLAGLMFNDLQAAAVAERGALAEVIEAATSAGALCAQVSGSGPTVVALAPDGESGRRIAAKLQKLDSVARAIVTQGPALGARIEGK